jgi:cyclopropane fatty-acyl-phospholipid synthase-like methyltransferase
LTRAALDRILARVEELEREAQYVRTAEDRTAMLDRDAEEAWEAAERMKGMGAWDLYLRAIAAELRAARVRAQEQLDAV